MKLSGDYQWPYLQNCMVKKTDKSLKFRPDLFEKIESFFSKKYNCHALLFPSGRSGLSAIMRFQQLDRSDIVFTSKWSSKCVFDVISNYANPSVVLSNEVNRVLAVHKWGRIYKVDESLYTAGSIIEDSVDSFIRDEAGLFPNGGKFEVLSLPKLIGGYCGGIVLTRDEKFVEFAKSLQGKKMDLAIFQSQLKQGQKIESTPFVHWAETELQNFSLTEQDLLIIEEQLGFWESYQDLIFKRLNKLKEKIKPEDFIHDVSKRIGPVLPLDLARYNLGNFEGVMTRNFSKESNISKLNFTPHLLVPLHFGVNDDVFNRIMEKLNYLEREK